MSVERWVMAQSYPTVTARTSSRPSGSGNLLGDTIAATERGRSTTPATGSLPYGQIALQGLMSPGQRVKPARLIDDVIGATNAAGIWDRPRRQQVIRYARLISQRAPDIPLTRIIRIALGLHEFVSGDAPGGMPVRVPGAGFRLVAQCATGGFGDRPWNTSTIPATALSKNIVNNCTVSPAFFPGSQPDYFTKSFGWVQSMPLPGLPNRAKALQFWERVSAGYINQNKPWYQDEPVEQEVAKWAQLLRLPVLRMPLETPTVVTRPRTRDETPAYDRTVYWAMGTAQVALDSGRIRVEPSSHRYEPPPPGVKEGKLRGPKRQIYALIMNVFTESGDAIEAMHDALPAWARRSRTWKDKKTGKWHRRRIDSMLRDLFNNWEHLDWLKAGYNLGANEIEDKIIGKTNQYLNSRSANFNNTGVQGMATRASGGSGGAGESRNPFEGLSALKDRIGDYLGVGKDKGRPDYQRAPSTMWR